jgi:hypothetical protein
MFSFLVRLDNAFSCLWTIVSTRIGALVADAQLAPQVTIKIRFAIPRLSLVLRSEVTESINATALQERDIVELLMESFALTIASRPCDSTIDVILKACPEYGNARCFDRVVCHIDANVSCTWYLLVNYRSG